MTAFTNITDTEIQQGKPIRALTGRALRDNPLAIAEGDASAPRIQSAALQSRISFDYSNLSRFGVPLKAGFVGINTAVDGNMNAAAIIAKDTATAGMHAAPGGWSATVSSGNLRTYLGNFQIASVSVGSSSGNGTRHAFIANDGFVYVCSAASTGIRKYDLLGNLIWTVTLSSNPSAVWVQADDAFTVYAGDTSGRIYKITQTSGGSAASITSTWTGISSTNPVYDIVQDLDGFLYVGFNPASGQSFIQKLNSTTGATVWGSGHSVLNGGRGLALSSTGVLILGTAGNQRVYGINASTGAQLWEATPSGDGITCVAVNPQGIIAASNQASSSSRTHLLDLSGNILGFVTNSANFANHIRCELGDYAHHWDNIDPEA